MTCSQTPFAQNFSLDQSAPSRLIPSNEDGSQNAVGSYTKAFQTLTPSLIAVRTDRQQDRSASAQITTKGEIKNGMRISSGTVISGSIVISGGEDFLAELAALFAEQVLAVRQEKAPTSLLPSKSLPLEDLPLPLEYLLSRPSPRFDSSPDS